MLKSVIIIIIISGRLIQVVFGHWDVVTCLVRSESYIGGNCYILSGSRDATLLLWYWNGKSNSIGDYTNGKKEPCCYCHFTYVANPLHACDFPSIMPEQLLDWVYIKKGSGLD